MKRVVLLVIGILAVLAGVVWTLQGLDMLGGSGGMNGNKMWAVIGPVVAIIGLVIASIGMRKRS